MIVRITGSSPNEFHQDLLDPTLVPQGRFGGMSWDHPMGIEPQNGRDIFAEIVYGARISLLVAFLATLVSVVLGTTLGVVAGYFGGWVDTVISRAMDVFLAFPVLWAASHLRWAAVALVTGAAVVGDGVTQLVLQPVEPAVHDALVVGTVLVVAAVILVRAAALQDGLVAALQRQADVDPLTGLVTRRVLDDALTGALEREPTGEGTALVLLDVDSFKQINDAHGHPVGDDALVHLSGLVRRQVRAGDAVVGRLGGDELALLLPGCTAGTAARRAHELLEAVRSSPLPRTDGGPLPLSISVGVAHAPLHAASVRELYAAADAALYEAKRAGRDRVEVAVSPVGPVRGLPRQRSAP